jgi:hypothetical protein
MKTKLTVLGIISILYFFGAIAACIYSGTSLIPALQMWVEGVKGGGIEGAVTSIFSLILAFVVWVLAMIVIFGLGIILAILKLIGGIKKIGLTKEAKLEKLDGNALGVTSAVFDILLLLCGLIILVVGFSTNNIDNGLVKIGLVISIVFLVSTVLDFVGNGILKTIIKKNRQYLEELRKNSILDESK